MFKKTSLITLCATALALLSAPAVNAFADDSGSNTPQSADLTKVVGQINNNGTEANAGLGTANSDSGGQSSVVGKSDAHITVLNGYLVLEEVPSLGFQPVSARNTDTKSTSVIDHKTVLSTDSFAGQRADNKPTTLTVNDSRTTDGNGKPSGYNVTAQLGNFGTYDDTKTGPDNFKDLTDGNQGNFTLNLAGQFANGNNGDGKSTISQNVYLPSDNSTTNTVLTNSSVGTGSTSVSFDAGDGNGSKTSLTVPQKIKAGLYAGTITWTLTPGLSSTANNGAPASGSQSK